MAVQRLPKEIYQAFAEGYAVVHRKHKRRQATVGPTTAIVDELFLVIDGQLEMMTNNRERWVQVQSRTLACFRRGVLYGIRQTPGYEGPTQIINILFQAPKKWDSGLPRTPLLLSAPWMRRLMALESRCDYDTAGQRVLHLNEIVDFVERLARAAVPKAKSKTRRRATTTLSEGPLRPDTGAEWMELWTKAEDVIQQQAGSGLSVDELADALHVSPTQLRRVFHSARGISPKAALTQWRIEEAIRLLSNGKCNVTQVAEKVGFSTLQRFSAVFKKYTGQSPSEYSRKV